MRLPDYTADEDYAHEMEAAKFQIVPTHDEATGEELYYIVCGPTSGKADEMIFLNRNVGDWLDTWTKVSPRRDRLFDRPSCVV